MDEDDEPVDLNVDSEDDSNCRTRKQHAMFVYTKRRRRLLKVLRLVGVAKERVYESYNCYICYNFVIIRV